MFHNAPSPRHGVPQGSFSWLSSSTTLPKSCVVKFVPPSWFWIRHYRASIVFHPVALSTHSRSRQGRSQWEGPDANAFAIYAHWLKRSKPKYTPRAHGDSIQSGNLAFSKAFQTLQSQTIFSSRNVTTTAPSSSPPQAHNSDRPSPPPPQPSSPSPSSAAPTPANSSSPPSGTAHR